MGVIQAHNIHSGIQEAFSHLAFLKSPIDLKAIREPIASNLEIPTGVILQCASSWFTFIFSSLFIYLFLLVFFYIHWSSSFLKMSDA